MESFASVTIINPEMDVVIEILDDMKQIYCYVILHYKYIFKNEANNYQLCHVRQYSARKFHLALF